MQTPVFPPMNGFTPNGAYSSSHSVCPPPASTQATCSAGVIPNGTVVKKAATGILPCQKNEAVWPISHAVADRIQFEGRHHAGGMHRDVELAA